MRAVSRLSINTLVGRRSRTALLTAAVALSTSLVCAIACALASLNAGMEQRLASTIGAADITVRQVVGERFDASVLDDVRASEGVALAAPRTREAVTLRASPAAPAVLASLQGIDPALEYVVVSFAADAGRRVESDDEIVLDRASADDLGVGVGDEIVIGRPDSPRRLRVVGIVEPKTIELVDKPGGYVTIDALRAASGLGGTLHEIQIVLAEGADLDGAAASITDALAGDMLVRKTERVTSGIDSRVQANELFFLLATILSYIASAFIVLTGLTTGVQERQRELAVLRCVGAARTQLAGAQLATGAAIGAAGAAVGVPLGVVLAWIVTILFPDRLPAGLRGWEAGLVAAAAGAIGSGVLGALWPAFNASRAKPLVAMASHARRPTRRSVVVVTALALFGLAVQFAVVSLTRDPTTFFWLYSIAGLPLMFVGYFLLGVPVALLLAWGAAPWIGRAFGLPRRVLSSSLRATPFRNGFTAGALMVGLAMMVSIWTNGSAVLRDWLGEIRFPDAFVNGLLVGLTPEMQERLEGLEFVEQTCAITITRVDSEAFGFTSFQRPGTTFIAFEVDEFFEMTKLHWVAGTPEGAIPKIRDGSGVLVAQEFLVEREGYGLGDMFPITHRGETREFEIVGAVSSPGLDIVKRYFDFEQEYAEQSIHAVFGSREAMRELFKTDAIHLIQIGLRGDISDNQAVERIRAALDAPGVVVGSGREIKERITEIGKGSMRIASIVALGAMLIGCFGVANVVIAGIDARRYEFGVLRAVGAGRALLARLLFGEVLVIALVACILGTMLGLQGAWAGQRLSALAAGLELRMRPPLDAIALGWAILIVLTLAFVAPIVLRVSTLRARALLQSTRG